MTTPAPRGPAGLASLACLPGGTAPTIRGVRATRAARYLGVATVLVALSATACGSAPASPARRTPTGAIQGYLFAGPSGDVVLARTEIAPAGTTPLAATSVTLDESPVDAKPTATSRDAKTDAKGFVSLSGVPAGQWTLHVPRGTGAAAAAFPLLIVPDATLTWGAGTVSRAAAFAIAQKTIGALPADKTFVLAPQTLLPAGVVIRPALGNDDGDADTSLELKTAGPQWFFYADLAAGSRFQHATKFVLVDGETGAVTMKDESSWPSLNGATYYATAAKNVDSPDALVKPAIRPGATPPVKSRLEPNGARPAFLAPGEDHVPGCTNPMTYSLVIQGSDEGSMENDREGILDNVVKGATQHVWTPSPGAHPVAEVQALWAKIQAAATPCDSVVIYITAHGTRGGAAKLETDLVSKDGIPVGFESFTASTLNFKSCKACHILIIIDTCYSGKMLNDFAKILQPLPGRKATVMSATDATHESGAYEWYNLKGRTGSAFTNAVVDAWKSGGQAPNPQQVFNDANTEIAGTAFTDTIQKQSPQYWTRTLVPGETCSAIPTGTINPPPTPQPTPPVGAQTNPPSTASAPLVFRSFIATFQEDLSTTSYKIAVDDPAGGQLLYYWSIKASCGNIAVPQQHTDQNGYFHGGCDVNTVERAAVLTVRIVRSADVADPATGAVKSGAGFATYVRSARAHDSNETASWALNEAFLYEIAK